MRALSLLALLLSAGCGAASISAAARDHNLLGAELLSEGDLERAEARFRLALEFQPGYAEARANLGLVALARGDLRAAEDHLRGAVGLREDFGEAWGNLGVVLEGQGRDGEARQAYERALAIHPGLAFARRDLAWLLARRGDLVAARAHLLRLTELVPDDADAAGLLAWCELRLDRVEAAREIAERALEADPDAIAPLLVRGILRARQGAYDDALADLELVRDDPRLGREARIRIAAIETITGAPEDALRAMEELIEEDDDDPAIHLVAASAALAAERWDRARHHADEVLRARPDLAPALIVLADACARSGDHACAERALARIEPREGTIAREIERVRAALR